jgi:hypothetical protein
MYIILSGCLVYGFFKGAYKHFYYYPEHGGGPISIYIKPGNGGFTF